MATAQYLKMTQTPPHRLVLQLCIPTIISMLVTHIYNLVDTYFVSQLGRSASGAIGIVFSLMAMIQAIGFMLGHGGSTIVVQLLGRQEPEHASRFASTAFFLALAGGTLLSVLGLLFLHPLMRLLGSTETILPYACDYGIYILISAPVMAASCVLNNLLRYEGRAVLAMVGLGTGAVLNMIGTPLLMFPFRMGVGGAGLSTAISQCISFLILISMFLRGRTQCTLSVKRISRDPEEVLHILKNGMPSLARQGLSSVSSMVLNHQAGIYGDAAVAAISIVGRICNFITSLAIGIGQGMQPVLGFNYGARKYSRVRQAFRFTVLLSEAALACLALCCFASADRILGWFGKDAQVIQIAFRMFRVQSAALLVQPFVICTNMLFQSLGISGKATLLSSLRSGLLLIPLVYGLTALLGLPGLQIAQALSDAAAFLIVLPLMIGFFAKLPREDAELEPVRKADDPNKQK